MVKIAIQILCVLMTAYSAIAAEESLDLDTIAETTAKPTIASVVNRFSLMGRVDITSETSAPNEDSTHEMKNNHFLVFLKVNASSKTSFMGQLISDNPNNVFYYVDYRPNTLVSVQFGKILVPFGDTRRFHHIYGGVQDLNTSGVMLPNIWAETGFNLAWHVGTGTIDTYVVNSAVDGNLNIADDPEVSQSTSGERQAAGLRYTLPTEKKVTILFSGYQGSYSPGNGLDLNILGFDLYSEYNAFDLAFLKHLRFSVGVAHATFVDRLNEGDVQQIGDYLEFASNSVGPGEIRLRYGTYVDNDKVKSERDTHALAVGYSMPIDVMRVLVEYQFNYEAVNEQDNDMFRAMASLDF
jgi:hypothetical protein